MGRHLRGGGGVVEGVWWRGCGGGGGDWVGGCGGDVVGGCGGGWVGGRWECEVLDGGKVMMKSEGWVEKMEGGVRWGE